MHPLCPTCSTELIWSKSKIKQGCNTYNCPNEECKYFAPMHVATTRQYDLDKLHAKHNKPSNHYWAMVGRAGWFREHGKG